MADSVAVWDGKTATMELFAVVCILAIVVRRPRNNRLERALYKRGSSPIYGSKQQLGIEALQAQCLPSALESAEISTRPLRAPLSLAFTMRRMLFAMFFLGAGVAWAADPPAQPSFIAKPGVLQTLLHPNCSHCQIENLRRKDELRSDDRVLAWLQVQADGYINDGVISPSYRFKTLFIQTR